MQQPLSEPAAQPRLLYVQTFGCQMNEYDSSRVQGMLQNRGYDLTSDINLADVIFLNTCSVREKAEQKVHSFLGRLRRAKALNPELKILVAGCMAQHFGERLLGRYEHLDLVLGTRSLGALPGLLEKIQRSHERVVYLGDDESSSAGAAGFSTPLSPGITAPVTIMQGCDNFCSYCIVPYVRGRERSRPSAEILKEIRFLVENGKREILLLGQNVNSYGISSGDGIFFADLLRAIEQQTPPARLRFTTSHPKDLTDELMECFAQLDCLCRHLHLPVQSGSDRILKLMNRGYTALDYLGKIERLRRFCPDIGLTSDVMVGFPGETERDFQDTLDLLERVRFDTVFSFRYSDRPQTKATRFSDKIPDAVKASRLVELQALQAEITLQKNQAEVGKIRDILVEGPSKSGNGQMTGRTEQNRVTNFEGAGGCIGQLVPVKIIAAFSHSLKAQLLKEPVQHNARHLPLRTYACDRPA
jgi:tRNA-2-methylthio-N6-dimethylallyladenosine synthase